MVHNHIVQRQRRHEAQLGGVSLARLRPDQPAHGQIAFRHLPHPAHPPAPGRLPVGAHPLPVAEQVRIRADPVAGRADFGEVEDQESLSR